MHYFTADLHLDHTNIIIYCNRPFGLGPDIKDSISRTKATELMNDTIINNINQTVKENDTLWVLGDFAFAHSPEHLRSLRNRIVCRNITAIRGNHDKSWYSQVLGAMKDMDSIEIGGNRIVLCHYPMLSWNASFHGSWHLFGHCHGNMNPWLSQHLTETRMLDIGVDCHNFKPLSFEEIRDYMLARPAKHLS